MLNDFIINPAIAGSKPFFPLRLNVREQWEGLGDFAPSTQSLSFHAPIGDGRVGLGGLIFKIILIQPQIWGQCSLMPTI